MPLKRVLVFSATLALVIAVTPVARAGGPGDWTKVSSGDISSIAEPGLLRMPDGDLHIVFMQMTSGGDDAYAHTEVSETGNTKGTAGERFLRWDALIADPDLIPVKTGGMRLVFSGIGPSPRDGGEMYSMVGDSDGDTWVLSMGSMSSTSTPYTGYGNSAVMLADGTPVTSWPLNDTIYYHVGISGSIPAITPDETFNNGDCCAYNTKLVRDGSKVYLAWYGNGDTAGSNGTFVRRILPTEGPEIKAPGSSVGSNSLSPDQEVAMAARTQGGTYVAYCVGYPTCDHVGLWKVGSDHARRVPMSSGADSIALAASKGGRLWVAWEKNSTGKIYAVRTNSDANRFGAVRTIDAPASSFSVYRLAIEGSTGRGDIIINDADFLWHQQVLPGLRLAAWPRRGASGRPW